MADATAKLAKAEIRGGARVATKAGGAGKGAAAAAGAEGEDYAPTGLDDRFQSTGREGNSQLILCVRRSPPRCPGAVRLLRCCRRARAPPAGPAALPRPRAPSRQRARLTHPPPRPFAPATAPAGSPTGRSSLALSLSPWSLRFTSAASCSSKEALQQARCEGISRGGGIAGGRRRVQQQGESRFIASREEKPPTMRACKH